MGLWFSGYVPASTSIATTGTQSIASTTFATVGSAGAGATPLSLTFNTRGNTRVLLSATGTWSNSSNGGNNRTRFQFLLDGATIAAISSGQADGGSLAVANAPVNLCMINPSVVLAAGSHTVVLQWAVTNAATTSRCNVGTNDEGIILIIEELGS